MQDNISTTISNALTVDKKILNEEKIKLIINQIHKVLHSNREAIINANEIDLKNKNAKLINFKIINNIFNRLLEQDILYGKIIKCQKDDNINIIYGTQLMDTGNVIVINDGNSYTILEMFLKNIMAGNTTIFVNKGFMCGTNHLIIKIIQSVLEQFELSKYFVQIYITENYDEVLSNYANIDLVVCIGNHSLQTLISQKSRNKTIFSGYENFDLYIEDISHLEFLNEIINSNLNIQLYINKNVNLEYDDAILVEDIDEAIAQINYNGSRYSSAIFTNSSENASKFINEVRAKIVTINTSPTIERILDIKISDLVASKTIIYPVNFKLDGNKETIDLT